MYQYQINILDSGSNVVASFTFTSYGALEFWAQGLIQQYQPAGGSAVYRRRAGTWDGSAWSYGAWANWP